MAKAFQTAAADFAFLGYAWELVLRGAGAYLPDLASLEELIADLSRGQDALLEELGFAHRGDDFYVHLLDEEEACEPGLLIEALKQVRCHYQQFSQAESA